MKESQLIGTLMSSYPDLQSIIQAIREKYELPEVRLEDNCEKINSVLFRLALLYHPIHLDA
jgi:hypothetical protein